jgi:hypothetical protein
MIANLSLCAYKCKIMKVPSSHTHMDETWTENKNILNLLEWKIQNMLLLDYTKGWEFRT